MERTTVLSIPLSHLYIYRITNHNYILLYSSLSVSSLFLVWGQTFCKGPTENPCSEQQTTVRTAAGDHLFLTAQFWSDVWQSQLRGSSLCVYRPQQTMTKGDALAQTRPWNPLKNVYTLHRRKNNVLKGSITLKMKSCRFNMYIYYWEQGGRLTTWHNIKAPSLWSMPQVFEPAGPVTRSQPLPRMRRISKLILYLDVEMVCFATIFFTMNFFHMEFFYNEFIL